MKIGHVVDEQNWNQTDVLFGLFIDQLPQFFDALHLNLFIQRICMCKNGMKNQVSLYAVYWDLHLAYIGCCINQLW